MARPALTNSKFLRFVLALASALAGASASGQATPPPAAPKPTAAPPLVYRGRLVGVFDELTGQPMDSVEVRDMMSGLSAFTTRTGTLSLFFVDTGGSMIRFRKIGYQPLTILVANSVRDTVPLTITLAHSGQVLPTVVTEDSAPKYKSPQLRGFEARRKEGHGYFVTEAQLRKEDDRKMPEVLAAHVSGVSFVRGRTLGTYMTAGRSSGGRGTFIGGGAPCYPDVYLDGTLVPPQPDLKIVSIVAVDLGQFNLADIGAVEFYNTATLPPQFNATRSGCGALLLWTRER
jgi:hypothetical protein